jgi:hypothetical protein
MLELLAQSNTTEEIPPEQQDTSAEETLQDIREKLQDDPLLSEVFYRHNNDDCTRIINTVVTYYDENRPWIESLGITRKAFFERMGLFIPADSCGEDPSWYNAIALSLVHMEERADEYKRKSDIASSLRNDRIEKAKKQRNTTLEILDKYKPFYDGIGRTFVEEHIGDIWSIALTTEELLHSVRQRTMGRIKENGFEKDTDTIDQWTELFGSVAFALDNDHSFENLGDELRDREMVILSNANMFKTEYMNTTILPIGEYGEEITQDLNTAALLIGMQISENMPEFAKNNEHEVPLVRSIDNHSNDYPEALSLYEGVLSIAQAFNALLQDKVQGFKDPMELIKQLRDDKVIIEFARSIPFTGIIGPISVLGQSLVSPLEVTENGRLGIRDGIKELFRVLRKAGQTEYVQEIVSSSTNGNLKFMTYEGCPAAMGALSEGVSRNVVQELTVHFVEVLTQVRAYKAREAK